MEMCFDHSLSKFHLDPHYYSLHPFIPWPLSSFNLFTPSQICAAHVFLGLEVTTRV